MYLQAGRHRFEPFPLPLSRPPQRLVPAEEGGSIRKICLRYFLKTTNSLARPSLSRRSDRSPATPKFFCNDMRHSKDLGVCLQKSQLSSHGSPADLPRQERLRTNRLRIRIGPLWLPGPLSFRASPDGSLPKEGQDTQICESELSLRNPKRVFSWFLGPNISGARRCGPPDSIGATLCHSLRPTDSSARIVVLRNFKRAYHLKLASKTVQGA